MIISAQVFLAGLIWLFIVIWYN